MFSWPMCPVLLFARLLFFGGPRSRPSNYALLYAMRYFIRVNDIVQRTFNKLTFACIFAFGFGGKTVLEYVYSAVVRVLSFAFAGFAVVVVDCKRGWVIFDHGCFILGQT